MLITVKLWKCKKLKNVIFLLMLLKMCVVFGQQIRVVIDVGHGGKDSGAIGINGIQEKDVVLNIAKEIVKLNKTILDDKLNIYLTRYRDVFVSLADRGELVKALKADLFISIHCNASTTNSKGMEVYVWDGKAEESNAKKSIAVALQVLMESNQKLHLNRRGVKFGNFQVLRETIMHCPAILIEIGFINNLDESDYYSKEQNTRAVALAILMAIHKYDKETL